LVAAGEKRKATAITDWAKPEHGRESGKTAKAERPSSRCPKERNQNAGVALESGETRAKEMKC